MGYSRQEYWSGLPSPSPGYLPDPGIKPRSPALQADALPSELPGEPQQGRHRGGPTQVPALLPCSCLSPVRPSRGFWVSLCMSRYLSACLLAIPVLSDLRYHHFHLCASFPDNKMCPTPRVISKPLCTQHGWMLIKLNAYR
ncbi:unnamed protein product [Rangifer tarandus platyrhynchus]|uniref:Uncharacterized protein n=2 Tax=Rangifer tarandus platyrhynchus TaxID=3082113 RepID=A0AC59YUI5_RANTA|nr:unnamed protein product [Rangifer tarandus platyrhynchus]